MPDLWCPFAQRRPLNPESVNEPLRAASPAVAIFHTMVGSLLGTEANFDREDNPIESHFGLGGPTDGASLDGVWFQWMPLNRTADANLNANPFAISMETSDGGDASRPWSPKQAASLVRMGNWLHSEWGVPRRQCPAWNVSGFGWHVMFGAPGPWTPVAKTCPGPVRIKQLKEIVLPAIFAGKELDDMTEEQDLLLRQIHQALNVLEGGESVNQNVAFQRLYDRVLAIKAWVNLNPSVPTADAIADAVIARLPSGSLDLATVVAAFEGVLARLNVNTSSNVFVDPS